MTSTVFVNQATPVVASWLNDVDGATYKGSAVYTPAGTGAVATTVQGKLNYTQSLIDYGADKTGVSDSTVAISNTEVALPGSAGGIMNVPVGTYLTSGWTPTQTDMVVQGEGNRTSVIKGTGAGSSAIAFNNLARTHWKDIKLDGGEVKTSAVTILGSSGVNLFTNVRFGGGTTNTVSLGTAGGSDDIADSTWVNCTIQSDNCSGGQLKVRGNNTGSLAFIGGRISTGSSSGAGIKAIDIDDGATINLYMVETLGNVGAGAYNIVASSGTVRMYGGHCEGEGLIHTLSTDSRTDKSTTPHVLDGVTLATTAAGTTIYSESPRTLILKNTRSGGNIRVGASGRVVLDSVSFDSGASPVIDTGGELVALDLPKGTYAVAAAGYLEDSIVNSIATTPANVSGLWLFNEDASGTTITDRGTLGHSLTLSKAANLLSQRLRGFASSLLFGNNTDYFTTPNHADFNFGNSTTDSPFSIVVMTKLQTSGLNVFLSKGNNSTGPMEWDFYMGGDSKIYANFTDQSTGGVISRSYNTSLSGDVGTVTVYVLTYSGSSLETGIKIYRNGVRIDDTTNNSGSYIAMEASSEIVKNYHNAPGIITGNDRRYLTAVFKEELTSSKVTRISRLLLAHAGVAL